MAKQRAFYPLPDYNKVTTDLDMYLAAWREVAEPIEQHLGLKMIGFDPDFAFTRTSKDGTVMQVSLPLWFTRELSAKLNELDLANSQLLEQALE